MLISSNN